MIEKQAVIGLFVAASGFIVGSGFPIVVGSGFSRTLYAQASQTRRHVETLASEKLDGRLTGSTGERLAADYIISELRRIGARPLPARPHGAKAMLVVTGPRSPNAGELVPMTFDTAIAGSGIVAASITGDFARNMLSAVTDKTLDSVQQPLDTGNPHVAGFELPG